MSVLRRVRAFAGQLGLLAVLAALAAFLVSGPVRLSNGHTDDGLRGDTRIDPRRPARPAARTGRRRLVHRRDRALLDGSGRNRRR
jgi:hypothetical protein